jgi:hypothetical protein
MSGTEWQAIELLPLVEVHIELREGAPVAVGRTPWRNRRISDIGGGRFSGPRLNGRVRASGADWSEGGRAGDDRVLTLIDVRSLWETDDGELIYVTYGGRLCIPDSLVPRFADPAALDAIDPADYYFRITPTFETASTAYGWLNEIVAVGRGRRTGSGVSYQIFEVR